MIALTCGILVFVSIYLLLETSLIRKIFGLVLLGNVINLIILVSGRLTAHDPVFIDSATNPYFANPLPQALILTAIVIGFGLLAFLCALTKQLLTLRKRDKP